jgi:putative transposase
VNGEWLFDDVAKEVFRRQLRQVSEYCGVEIITYVVLSNHFHLLVRVPQKTETTDAELLRRHSILYPQPTPYQLARLEVIRSELLRNGPEAIAWRRRQLTLMGDVSQFLKLLKQRFSIWFNKRHRRFGTLWAERFKSVLVEQQPHVLRKTTAFVRTPKQSQETLSRGLVSPQPWVQHLGLTPKPAIVRSCSASALLRATARHPLTTANAWT